MDQLLLEHLAERAKREMGIDVLTDRTAEARLREAAETAKVELSTSTTARISLPFLIAKEGEPQNLDLELSRSELERIVRPVIERCRGPIEQVLHDAEIAAKDIDRVVLVGGPTRMPCVRAFFEEVLGRPAERGVDPMECVAQGAAIQAGVLAGEMGDIVLVDVTPLTLGIETLGGVATPLIARNTPVPVKRSETFTTAADMQTSVTVHVVQGERPMAGDNTSLGQFNLDGLAPAPRGIPKIEVAFDIDADGILNVSAEDQASKKTQSIRITGSTRLPTEEKERMVRQAEKFSAEDKKRREAAEKLNNADAICYQAERTMADFGDKIAEDLKTRIQSALGACKDAVAKKEPDEAAEKAEALKTVLQEVGQAIYAQTAEAAPHARPDVGEPTGEARPAGGPRVVDAQYKEAGDGKVR